MVSEEREENVIPASAGHLHYDCTCMCIVYVYCVCVHCKTYTVHCKTYTHTLSGRHRLLTLVAAYHLLAVVHHVCVMDYSAYMYMYCTCTVVILQYIQCTYTYYSSVLPVHFQEPLSCSLLCCVPVPITSTLGLIRSHSS